VVDFQLFTGDIYKMVERHLQPSIVEALADTPVVFLNGARQTGKSYLVHFLATGVHPARYFTLDDLSVLAAARNDPTGFLAGLEGPLVLDEVQRAPELFLAIKAAVDRDRSPGRFLLTGSADILLLPELADSLAGRMEILTLWPFSQGEIEGQEEGFADALFADELPALAPSTPQSRNQLIARIVRGGYPEIANRPDRSRQRAFFDAYITTLLQRDIRDLANIEGLTAMPRLLSLLAARATGLVNFAELSRTSALPQSTLKRYLSLFETTFLVQLLPAWSSNRGKRLVKAPKLLLNDTGLLAHLLGINAELPEQAGPLLENFVAMELRKQSAWARTRIQLFHFRTHAGREVDLVLEDDTGRVVGIETKASATIRADDFKGLHALAEQAGDRFHRGVVLYGGTDCVPFGPRLHALPVEDIWRVAV
jgi:predicted AAA+ superfamily ATPase